MQARNLTPHRSTPAGHWRRTAATILFSFSCTCVLISEEEPPPPFSPVALRAALNSAPTPDVLDQWHRSVMKAFGQENLLKGKPSVKVEGTTTAWAVIHSGIASVVREDGKVLGEMTQLGADGLQVLTLELPNFIEFNYRVVVEGRTCLGGYVRLDHFERPPESIADPAVPTGKIETFDWNDSQIFPNTHRRVSVYFPSGHTASQPVALMVWQDGSRAAALDGSLRVPTVLDHLIHRGEMPPTVAVFIDPGSRPERKEKERPSNHSFEYDTLSDAYSRFLIEEILPEVERRWPIQFVDHPKARATAGGSSGGICAMNTAWERPDHFHKVLCWVGSFVNIRGGHVFPQMILETEPKAIRVYLLGGENDLVNQFGSWPKANRAMADALRTRGYDSHLEWTQCFHGSNGMAHHLPNALRWLWRDWKTIPGLATTP